jgi:UDPglucose--hexose-1-phosphate uridylyltransferase
LLVRRSNTPTQETDDFVSVAAYAGRFPFETWILPRRHRSHFEVTTEGERVALACALHALLKKLQVGLCDPPFNLVLHNAPLHSGELDHYHWHVEIIPRLSQPAGFEWGTNWSVNLVPPEQAAEYLGGVS